MWEALSSTLAYWFAVLLVASPIYMVISGVRLYRAEKAKDEEQIARFLPLFEGKRTSSLGAIQHSTIFFLRRYLLIFVLVIYRDWRFLQIHISMSAAIIMTSYTIIMRPF